MKVKDKTKISETHSIEWGYATWDNNSISIRNRYDSIETGKFNKAGSSEIPWNDFKLMIEQSILKKKLNNQELSEILKCIADTIK
jgi:hypothetical protein